MLRSLLTRFTSQYVSEHWNYVIIIFFLEKVESSSGIIKSEYIVAILFHVHKCFINNIIYNINSQNIYCGFIMIHMRCAVILKILNFANFCFFLKWNSVQNTSKDHYNHFLKKYLLVILFQVFVNWEISRYTYWAGWSKEKAC